MAGRIRTIKPEVLEDERPAALSDGAWRLWVSMWLIADDHGNCRADAKYLRAQVWWAHDTPPDVTKMVTELRAAGSISLYSVRGQTYAHVNRWEKHQRVDNAGNPRVPSLNDAEAISLGESPRTSEDCGSDHDQRPTTTNTTNERQFSLTSPSAPESVVPLFDFASVYKAYPRKEGKTKGIVRLRSQVRTPEAFAELQTAVRHFAEKHAAEGTEQKYIPHFSTWCNASWRDFIDGPHIDADIVARRKIADARGAGTRGHARASASYDKTRDGTGDL